jgi:beta-galactosidase/beta-glucuronidase
VSTLHTIRLRGPWEYTVEARTDASISSVNLPPRGRVTMPATWAAYLGADFRGRVAYLRRFGKPTNLAPTEQVWLVCEGAAESASLAVNGHHLGSVTGPSSPAEFDVTKLLGERNELVATVESSQATGGLTGEVRLEIREASAKQF